MDTPFSMMSGTVSGRDSAYLSHLGRGTGVQAYRTESMSFKSAMTAAAICGIAVGEVAVVIDLGNRLFGSYVRTRMRAFWRGLVIVASSVLLATPACILATDWRSATGRALLLPFGLAGGVLFVHFLFPCRWGIRKVRGADPHDHTERLANGVVLRDSIVEVEALPGPLTGLRLLLISDLHCNSRARLQVIRHCLGRVASEGADLVFVLGDLGENEELLADIIEAVARIPSQFGTFCVRGNHDFEGGRAERIKELLEEASLTVLDNALRFVPGIDVVLVGVEAPWHKMSRPEPPNGGFVIGLTHTPDNFRLLEKLRVRIAVAGHTHGGRLRLPLVGPLLVPTKWGRFLHRGLFSLRDSLMYVTAGIGYSPGAFGRTGEIVRLTLKPADSTGGQR